MNTEQMRLRIEELSAPGVLAQSTQASVEDGDLRVLLVEDDDADAYLIELALNDNPRVAAVLRARDGVEALEIVDQRNFTPDLAIVDLNMPRKNGFALLSELGARVMVDFPSVVFTSARSSADAMRSKKRGAVQYLTKPNRASEMSGTLDRVVANVGHAGWKAA